MNADERRVQILLAMAAGAAIAYAVLQQLWIFVYFGQPAVAGSAVIGTALTIATCLIYLGTAVAASRSVHWIRDTVIVVGAALGGGLLLAALASYALQRASVFPDIEPLRQLWSFAPTAVIIVFAGPLLAVLLAALARRVRREGR